MSLSIQSSIHAVAKVDHEVQTSPAKKATNESLKAEGVASKAPVLAPKAAAKLDERTQIQQLALQGHSNEQIAAVVGLPVSAVALTLGDATILSASTSEASALIALSGRLSVSA